MFTVRLFTDEQNRKEIDDWLQTHQVTRCPTVNPVPAKRTKRQILEDEHRKYRAAKRWSTFRELEFKRQYLDE